MLNSSVSKEGPDALHVGFSKCASTFLQAYLEDHPSVFLVNQSHYLAPFDMSRFPQGRKEYLSLFNDSSPNQVRLESDEHIILPLFHPELGAAATTIASVMEVVQRIKTIRPDAKIIMVVRNQCSLLVSRYSEYVICGGIRKFDDFVHEFLKCSSDGLNYFQNYYAQILDIFEREFLPGHVLLLLQEELQISEAATIDRLSNFLGIEYRKPVQRGAIVRRVGLSSRGISFVRAMNRMFIRKPKQSFQEADVRIPFLLYKVLLRLIRLADYYLSDVITGDKNAILTDELQQLIRQEFRDDNKRLSDRLDRDLAELGYY